MGWQGPGARGDEHAAARRRSAVKVPHTDTRALLLSRCAEKAGF